MKSTVQYLDAVKDRLDLPSDYAIAKALDVTRSAVSSYRTGRTVPDDLVCARIAEILGCEPMEVIAATNYQRSKTDEARRLWENIWGKAAGAIALNLIACVVGALAVAPSPARASEQANSATFYLMSNQLFRLLKSNPVVRTSDAIPGRHCCDARRRDTSKRLRCLSAPVRS